jgi:hypothetical protein
VTRPSLRTRLKSVSRVNRRDFGKVRSPGIRGFYNGDGRDFQPVNIRTRAGCVPLHRQETRMSAIKMQPTKLKPASMHHTFVGFDSQMEAMVMAVPAKPIPTAAASRSA